MSIFHSLIRKEVLHLLRDPRTVTVVLVMPVVLLLLFGFAISTEVNGVRLLAVVGQHTDETHRLLERFRSNPYFTLEGIVAPHEADDLLRQGKADAVLVLRTDDGQLTHQVITDASNTNLAQTATAYIESVVSGTSPSPVVLHTLYNPQLKSAYQFVPGIMGMIFILICSMMTSVSIVSERESGTMDLLLVSPVRPRTIILGKLVPYFLLSCLLLGLMLTLSYTVLGLPFSPSALHVVWLSLLYIVLALGLGMRRVLPHPGTLVHLRPARADDTAAARPPHTAPDRRPRPHDARRPDAGCQEVQPTKMTHPCRPESYASSSRRNSH